MMDNMAIDALILKYSSQEKEEHNGVSEGPERIEEPVASNGQDPPNSMSHYFQNSQNYQSSQPTNAISKTKSNPEERWLNSEDKRAITPNGHEKKKKKNKEKNCSPFYSPYQINTEVGAREEILIESARLALDAGDLKQELKSMGIRSVKSAGDRKNRVIMESVVGYLLDGRVPAEYLKALESLISE